MPRGSSEIQFFMTRKDEKAFLDFVLSDRSIRLVRDKTYETPECPVYPDYDTFSRQPVAEPINQTPMWYIWNTAFGPKELNFREVPIYRWALEPDYKGDPQAMRTFYEIDCHSNPVVVFHRCMVQGDALELGRLAYQKEYWDKNDVLHVRDERVTRWYHSLRKWVKKHSIGSLFEGTTPAPGTRVFPDAVRWYRQGRKLCQLSMPFIPMEKQSTVF